MDFIADFEFYRQEGKQMIKEIRKHFTDMEILRLMAYEEEKIPMYDKAFKIINAYNKHDLIKLYNFIGYVKEHYKEITESCNFGKIIEDYPIKKMSENVYIDCEAISFLFQAFYIHSDLLFDYMLPKYIYSYLLNN